MAIRVSDVGADLPDVVRRPAADVQDEPGVGDLHDHWIALHEHLAVEDPLVEVTGTILVRDDQEVGDYEAILWCRKVIWVHIRPQRSRKSLACAGLRSR